MIDIQAGDVVVCADVSFTRRPTAPYIKLGQIVRVARVYEKRGEVGVDLVGWPPLHPGYLLRRFRKIQKADEGFATWMRSLRPVRQREDA